MNEYEQRQEARRERLERIAAKLESEGNARCARARELASCIPFGQPILVGHHSEKRDRAFRGRINAGFERGFADLKASAEYARRAESVGTGGISSDDPDAITKLREELSLAEGKRARMVAVNKAHAQYLKKPASLEAAPISDADKAAVRAYVPAYSWEPHPFAPFQVSNLGANIRRIKQRIVALEKQHAYAAAFGGEVKHHEVGAYQVVEAFGLNRVQVVFGGKPAANVRDLLKRYGFRWSPTEKAWQRMLSEGLVRCLVDVDGYMRKDLEHAIASQA